MTNEGEGKKELHRQKTGKISLTSEGGGGISKKRKRNQPAQKPTGEKRRKGYANPKEFISKEVTQNRSARRGDEDLEHGFRKPG